jgi:hypothetical protein
VVYTASSQKSVAYSVLERESLLSEGTDVFFVLLLACSMGLK